MIFVGSDDGIFHGVDGATGKQLWSRATTAAHFATPAVLNGIVYVSTGGSSPYELFAVDAATGKHRPWVWPAPAVTADGLRSPSVDSDAVYVGGIDAGLFAVARTSGSLKWAWHGAVVTEATIAIVGDILYLFGTDGSAYAIDRHTGQERWHLSIGGIVSAGTTVAGGRMFAATDTGHVIAIDGSVP